MTVSINVPRVNNNDDEVKLVGLQVNVGQPVQKGQVVAQVETDKAVVDVEAPENGFVLKIEAEPEAMLSVGAILIWLGETADTPVPTLADRSATAAPADRSRAPTAKAKALLAVYGIDPATVLASGERLSAGDVERHIAARGLGLPAIAGAPSPDAGVPALPGNCQALRSEERAMLATVAWHRDVAVPGYIEISYDPQPWEAYAQDFGQTHNLLLNPLLALMAWKLVELARETPRLNATIAGKQRYEYAEVNVGFTVQAGETLYLTVVRNAGSLGPREFAQRLIELQRKAAAHNLHPDETRGATIGFSSMARWKVSRHVPVLSPHTALMVAHTVDPDGRGVLGATYDHRVLNGAEVVTLLRKLGKPLPAR